MKKILFLLSMIALVIAFNPISAFAQKRAHDISIDSDQDADSVHIMISHTSAGKYRYGKYKSINLVRQRNLVLGYKEWCGYVTQSSTSAPTATVLANTLGGTLVWSYDSTGVYTATLTGAFSATKTVGASEFIDVYGSGNNTYSFQRGTDNTMVLRTYSDNGTTLANSLLTAVPIRFRVYN